MHPALWKLYWLRVRGGLRSMAGKLKSVRGAALGVFTVLVIGLMFGPNLVMAVKLSHQGAIGPNADSLGEGIPVAMLAYVVLSIVTSLGERAIYFSPADVDFLFPAPFSRRQILLYKILGNITAAISVALILPTSLMMHIRSWTAAAVGFFLAWLMVNSLTICAQLVAQSVTERVFSRARKAVLGGLIAVVAVALGRAASRGFDGPWQESLREARHWPAVEAVLAPFTVFAKVISAERLIPDALGWAALGAILVVGVYALAIRLDANYLETAVRVSQQIQERKRRVMSGGVFAQHSQPTVRSTRLPLPPWLGGVGPVVWRQMVQSLRSSRGVIVWAAVMAAAFAVPMFAGSRVQHGPLTMLPPMVIGVMAYMTFLFSAQVPLGFRGDFERMELLKALPIRPLAMALGQMIVVTILLTLLQWLAFAATAIFAPAATDMLLAAGLFALPFNWILLGTENFLFLLYPSPLVASGSEGFLKMGRALLFMLVKFLVLAVCGAAAAIPATVIILLTENIPAACLVAWLSLVFPAAGLLWLMAWSFDRYDVGDGTAES